MKNLHFVIDSIQKFLELYPLKEGIQFNFQDISQELVNAIKSDDLGNFTQLIELINLADDINKPLPELNGAPMLLYALWLGKSDIVKLLIQKGADLSAKDWLGTTALSFAIRSNNIDCFHFSKEELFIENYSGFSPLHFAVRNCIDKNDSQILDQLCHRFNLDKEKILLEYASVVSSRLVFYNISN